MEQYLIANPGSTSRKYMLYRDAVVVAKGSFRDQAEGISYTLNTGKEQYNNELKGVSLSVSLGLFLKLVQHKLGTPVSPARIGLRMVASGTRFQEHRWLDEHEVKTLEKQTDRLPLHIPAVLNEYQQLRAWFPMVPVLGISDSAFHKTQHEAARHYGLNQTLAIRDDLHRFGYHGLAAASAVNMLSIHYPVSERKVVLAHLGGGTSIIALDKGVSIYTSMGFSPLEGPMMMSRCGDLDPAIIMHLAELFPSQAALSHHLNTRCGMQGWTGTRDMSDLSKRYERGDPQAIAAINKYTADVLKYIGIAMMYLQGLDAIVFSGGVGENATLVRNKVLDGLRFLGLEHSGVTKQPDERVTLLTSESSAIKGFVIRINEEQVMHEVLEKSIPG